MAQVGRNMQPGGYLVKVVDVLDECVYFILIWSTLGLIQLNYILLVLMTPLWSSGQSFWLQIQRSRV
jgi:hypothetical protein